VGSDSGEAPPSGVKVVEESGCHGGGSSARYHRDLWVSISVRQHEDIISLWNRYEIDFRVREKIRWVLCFSRCHSGWLLAC